MSRKSRVGGEIRTKRVIQSMELRALEQACEAYMHALCEAVAKNRRQSLEEYARMYGLTTWLPEWTTSAVDRECPPGVGYVAGTEVVFDGKVVKL